MNRRQRIVLLIVVGVLLAWLASAGLAALISELLFADGYWVVPE